MATKTEKTIKEVTEKLLSLVDVEATAEVTMQDDHAAIVLTTEDSGILIGYHGETLEALQLIISLCAAKELGEFTRVSLEVGDYKKNREEHLKEMVEDAKQQVIDEGQAVSLPSLKSWERRFVHMLLADDTQVETTSSGEGRERTLEIKAKN